MQGIKELLRAGRVATTAEWLLRLTLCLSSQKAVGPSTAVIRPPAHPSPRPATLIGPPGPLTFAGPSQASRAVPSRALANPWNGPLQIQEREYTRNLGLVSWLHLTYLDLRRAPLRRLRGPVRLHQGGRRKEEETQMLQATENKANQTEETKVQGWLKARGKDFGG